jgi:hypothetical protein
MRRGWRGVEIAEKLDMAFLPKGVCPGTFPPRRIARQFKRSAIEWRFDVALSGSAREMRSTRAPRGGVVRVGCSRWIVEARDGDVHHRGLRTDRKQGDENRSPSPSLERHRRS